MSSSFSSIKTFRIALDSLCKKESFGYTSCKKDICNHFKNYSFEDIWEMSTRLRDSADIRMIKVRIPNSFQNLSASDGFRLIILCNRKKKTITFLNMYAKRGKLGMLDQSKEEYKRQLKSYIESHKNKELKQHNIANYLEILENQNIKSNP